jgi:hypothetical protein
MKWGYRFAVGTLLLLVIASVSASSAPALQWTWDDPTPSGDLFLALAYGNGVYVAVGVDGVLDTSADGVNWTAVPGGPVSAGGEYQDALFAGGRFILAGVASDGANYLRTSVDGVSWSQERVALGANIQYFSGISLAYGNGSFLAMGPTGFVTSPDGVNWTWHGAATNCNRTDNCGGVVSTGTGFVSLDTNAIPVYYSTDGVNWNQIAADLPGTGNGDVTGSDGTSFYLWEAGKTPYVYTSKNGDKWVRHRLTGSIPPYLNPDIGGVFWDGSRFVTEQDDNGGYVYTSPDGIAWSKAGAGTYTVGPHQTVLVGGSYTTASWAQLGLQASPDLINWTSILPDTNVADYSVIGFMMQGGG